MLLVDVVQIFDVFVVDGDLLSLLWVDVVLCFSDFCDVVVGQGFGFFGVEQFDLVGLGVIGCFLD